VGLGVAGQPAHPLQPRLGRPRRASRGRERKKYVWWDEERASGPATTCPTSRPTSARTTARTDDARGHGRDLRRRPVHHAGRRQGLAVRAEPGCSTGRCRRTTSRSSRRSRTRSTRAAAPTRRRAVDARRTTRYNPSRRPDVYPYVATTYRLTEHHTAGGMSRTCRTLGAAAGDVRRGRPRSWPPSAGSRTAAGRRSSPRARRSRRACWSPSGCGRCGRRPRRAPGRAAVPLGLHAAASSPATRPTTCSASCSTRTCTSRSPRRSHLRHPARPPAARPALRASSRSTARAGVAPGRPAAAGRRRTRDEAERARRERPAELGEPGVTGRTENRLFGPLTDVGGRRGTTRAPPRMGFFTDTTVCIGCKACEVACKEWNDLPEDGSATHRDVLRQHRRARRQHLAARRVRRAAQAAPATTCRPTGGGPGDLRRTPTRRDRDAAG
jgi:ferredoxin